MRAELKPHVSLVSQFFFSMGWAVQRAAHQPQRVRRHLFRAIETALRPLCGAALRHNPVVRANVWGQSLYMRANHHLPLIVTANPMWSLPLIHAVRALEKDSVQVIDVGANIGDTVALLESHLPGVCRYLCIEPDENFHALCEWNTLNNERVTLRQCFLGDTGSSELIVEHREPGTATTRIRSVADTRNGKGRPGQTLDDVAATLGGAPVDLIKIDTDGFDYKVLRSAVNTLKAHRPLLFFEWDPTLWKAQGEDPLDVFGFLGQLGYLCFAFFSDPGFFQTVLSPTDSASIESLCSATLARRGVDNIYFDVLAGPPEICNKAIQLNIEATRNCGARKQLWQRMQPAYWQ
jgi:FkbM family methyltransferase